MSTPVKCPHCQSDFDVQNVLSADLEQRIRQQYDGQQKEALQRVAQSQKKLEEDQLLFEEKRRGQNEIFLQKLSEEKAKLEAAALEKQKGLEAEMQQRIRKSLTADYENELRMIKATAAENEEKLRTARAKELAHLQREEVLKTKEAELELQLQKSLLEARVSLTEKIRGEEAEKQQVRDQEYNMKMAEMQKQLDDQRKLAEEMRRKAEQKSMQLQGEVQELLLEELLRSHFPFDLITPVGKGVNGADCILTVRNSSGSECGSIIFESKRTKDFGGAWIDKLKTDMRTHAADAAILVSSVYPKDFICFGQKDGVWVCSFTEVIALTSAMRHTILRVADTQRAEENKGDKMGLLYSYLTGNEFRQQIETIAESFLAMKTAITKERVQMEKMWKEREKQLERVLLSTAGMYGSVRGIAGASVQSIPLLDGEEAEIEEPSPKRITALD